MNFTYDCLQAWTHVLHWRVGEQHHQPHLDEQMLMSSSSSTPALDQRPCGVSYNVTIAFPSTEQCGNTSDT